MDWRTHAAKCRLPAQDLRLAPPAIAPSSRELQCVLGVKSIPAYPGGCITGKLLEANCLHGMGTACFPLFSSAPLLQWALRT